MIHLTRGGFLCQICAVDDNRRPSENRHFGFFLEKEVQTLVSSPVKIKGAIMRGNSTTGEQKHLHLMLSEKRSDCSHKP